jgi:hypothetical protein
MSTLTFNAERSTHNTEPKAWRVVSRLTPEAGEPVSTHSNWSEILSYFDTESEAQTFIRQRALQSKS